ncbi:MAG: queuosine salvage family protein [Chloroflexota bacterium]
MTVFGFEDVRAACAEVAAIATQVSIDTAQLERFAAEIANTQVPDPVWDGAVHFTGAESENTLFVFALDAINFGSGWFPVLRKPEGRSGYYTVAMALTEHARQATHWNAAALSQMDATQCAVIFGQQENEAVTELMEHFATALRQLGSWITNNFSGDPRNVLLEADHQAHRLVPMVQEMPYFFDVAIYDYRPVPLLKRAQILCADLSLALGGSPLGQFRDLDRLTLFADNLVPHVLRMEGVLVYDQSLLGRINAEQLLESGSPEEVEIRAVAVHAVELLSQHLGKLGRPKTPARLDHLLWHAGQSPSIKREPRHRCRCIWY